MWLDYVLIIIFFIVMFYLLGKSNAKLHQTSVKQEVIAWSISFFVFLTLFLAFFGVFYLPANIIHTLFIESCTIGYNKVPDMKIPVYINLLAIVIGFAVAWVVANKSENAGTINGMGTKLIGNEKTPDGYIATKWLVFLFLPILPVRSYEVFEKHQDAYGRMDFSMRLLPQLVKKQIQDTYRKYFFWYLLMASIIIGTTLIGTWKCF